MNLTLLLNSTKTTLNVREPNNETIVFFWAAIQQNRNELHNWDQICYFPIY